MSASWMRIALSLSLIGWACTSPSGNDSTGTGITTDAGAITDAGTDGGTSAGLSCHDAPPPGAPQPPPLPAYSHGTCPTLTAGTNTISTNGINRTFILAMPADLGPNEQLPVLFLWHWLGGSAEDFYEKGDIAKAVEDQRFIAVIPQEKGDLQFKWPDTALDSSQERFDEELTFFDDLLSCVGEQFHVNRSCVSTAGVSAGALWTDQLMSVRSEYLSSFLSLSGGAGGSLLRSWSPPPRKLPGLVLWGGESDTCVVNFDTQSRDLESKLDDGGHFYVECIHNCGHTVPPIDAAPGESVFASLWQFMFDHPYWLKEGASPYQATGLPSNYPEWCGVGGGSATPRTGTCAGHSGNCF